MPIYRFICDKCGAHQEEITLSIRENVPEPQCCDQAMYQDFSSIRKAVTGQYDKPILSNGLGVKPEQVPDMMKRYPNREYTPDGRCVFRNHYERNRILKEDGYHDNN